MTKHVCAICGKELTRYNAMRIGGMIEQITGKHFMCKNCVEDTHRGLVKIKVVDEW